MKLKHVSPKCCQHALPSPWKREMSEGQMGEDSKSNTMEQAKPLRPQRNFNHRTASPSKKIYMPGKLHPLKVAMREITLTDTVHKFNGTNRVEKNPPVTVYDTSGPYTDPVTTST